MTPEDLARQLVSLGAGTVLIDGRSGSGKSTIADTLHVQWPDSTIVRLDDIYPGWNGLAWAVDHVHTELLAPRVRGAQGRWRRWDWTTGEPAGWHTVSADQRLIVEGVGALPPANRALADLGIWVDTPDDVRKRRALQRDGDTYRPHWERWAAQEDDYLRRCHPRSAADIVVTEIGDELRWRPTPAWRAAHGVG